MSFSYHGDAAPSINAAGVVDDLQVPMAYLHHPYDEALI